ncbi:FadR/GntR family transcriptional regulator [Colwellia sp. 20A7]|uniref:FadR/GntR family transcriptional regulator n=1 Tax=Colwellia sp. 20A7 TaxID=2689569 RepID=UPI0013575EE9|nr:FCD domain-containing protein [Colwellia sp. 20A7]
MINDKKITSLKRATAYQLAEEALREKIMDGTLVPGDLLPVEHDLADQLGVTRPTVREALRKLESSGLVVRGPRRRMMVSAPCPSISSTAMQQAIVLHGISYRELCELNLVLEPAAAELAAKRISAEQLKKIEDNLERTAAFIDDPKKLVEADIEFHDLVAEATSNHALLLARAPVSDFLLPAYGAVVGKLGPGKRLLEAHTKIFNALKQGDADVAREWMIKHITDFLRGCEMSGISLDEPIREVNVEMDISKFSRDRS